MVQNNRTRVPINLDFRHIDSHVSPVPKNRRHLLQGQSSRVRPEKPHARPTDGAGDDEAEVELPADAHEGRRGRLQPDYIHERDHRDAEADAFGPEVRGEDLAEVGELRACVCSQ